MNFFGSKDFWISQGKGLLIQIAATVVTYLSTTLIPGLEKEGAIALSGLAAIAVNFIQKALRTPTK